MSRQLTPNYSFDTPNLDETPDVPRDLRTLAMGMDTALDTIEDRFSWQAYAVVWKQEGGTVLSIGNGTLIGRYAKMRNMVSYRVTLVRGSTTNLGSTYYFFTLPVAPAAYQQPYGSGYVHQVDGTLVPLTVRGPGGGEVALIAGFDPAQHLGPTSVDWETGDWFTFGGVYEASA